MTPATLDLALAAREVALAIPELALAGPADPGGRMKNLAVPGVGRGVLGKLGPRVAAPQESTATTPAGTRVLNQR